MCQSRVCLLHALDTILAEMEKPVEAHPAEPFFRDTGRKVEPRPGDVVASTEDRQRLRTAAFEAGFAMDRRLIPEMLRHMDDPPGQFHGDYADPSPAHEAMNALAQIIYGKEYAEQIARTPDQWKQWGREHEKEFVR